MTIFDNLVNRKITKVAITEDKDEIQFYDDTNNLYLGFETQGDCCNNVWIEHITGLQFLTYGIVSSTEGEILYNEDESNFEEVEASREKYWIDLDKPSLPDYDEEKDQKDQSKINAGVEEAGFWTINTDKGSFKIEVRNNHNGYYGGEIKFIGEWTGDFRRDAKVLEKDF